MGDRRGRRVLIVLGQHDVHAIGRQYLQRTGAGRGGQGMGIDADEHRAVDAFGLAVQADGLADGQDVMFVEAQVERAAPVAGGTEGHALGGDRGIGLAGVIGGQQSRDIDQRASWSRFTRQWTEIHAKPLKMVRD
ncbi:hypothetical protein D9M71_360950 [compost metagenome]